MPKGITETVLHVRGDDCHNRFDDKPKYLKKANESKIVNLRRKFELIDNLLGIAEISKTKAYADEVDRFLKGKQNELC